ncbi:MAG TPA: hypothetical protein PK402_06230 [Tepidisphaeraceae bacterium]|nr:hypothetical protein [Tepidisphaeraceae bacterium]
MHEWYYSAADGQHRAILPQEAQDILKNLGVSGMASVSGPITVFGDAERIDYDFNLHLTDGALRPENRSIQFTNLTADVHVRPTQTELKSITATRDDSTLIASGIVHHAGASTDYDIKGQLANLEVDADVVMSVEADQRAKVEMLKPSGRIDLDFNFTRADSKTGWAFDVAPKSLRITPDFCPVPFDVTSGPAHITLGSVELKEIVAQTGDTMLTLRGSLKADQYLLSGNVTNVSIDSDFVRALPEALSQVTKTSAKGIVDVELRSVDWKSDITKLPASESLTVDAVATLRGVSMDLGVAVSELVGTAPIVAHSENGKLTSLVGTLSAPTLLVSGLNATDGQMKIESSESARWINLKDIGFKFGGGEVAGSVTLDRSVADATKYTGELLLRDAEVKQLTTESDGTVEGRLSASLTVGGTIGGAPARGRGDLSVTGKNMLQVPMLIGLTQMVSLSLPFTSGFDQAQASYVFDGGVVNFENVMLQSREMTIRGTGQMDFETRKLDMRFYTDSNTGKLPVIGSVLEAARRELFQINVRGTLSEPTVKAGLLPTIGTSIDEVLGEK